MRETVCSQYNNAVSHYNFGLVLGRAKKGNTTRCDAITRAENHRAAVDRLRPPWRRDPNDEDSRLNLGRSYEALGSADASAIDQYRLLLKDNAKSAAGHTNLARLLQDRGDDREAVEHFRAAHDEEPQNYTTCAKLAVLLAASPDKSLRNGGEALRLARRQAPSGA